MRHRLLLVAMVPLVSCAAPHATTSPPSAALVAPLDIDDSPAPPPAHVARPQTPAEASLLITQAVSLLHRGDRAGALPLLDALLRCDFLTERGRANLYWLTADAATGIDPARRRDALAGYIVAASLLDEDDEIRDKTARARAALLADQVETTRLGTTPERAIVVHSAAFADSVVSALQCGRFGTARYVERSVLPTAGRDEAPLAARRLLCTENGDELVLWFRVEP